MPCSLKFSAMPPLLLPSSTYTNDFAYSRALRRRSGVTGAGSLPLEESGMSERFWRFPDQPEDSSSIELQSVADKRAGERCVLDRTSGRFWGRGAALQGLPASGELDLEVSGLVEEHESSEIGRALRRKVADFRVRSGV